MPHLKIPLRRLHAQQAVAEGLRRRPVETDAADADARRADLNGGAGDVHAGRRLEALQRR